MSKVLDHDTVWFQELAPRDYYNENDLERTVKLYLETIFPDYKVFSFKQKLLNNKTGKSSAADLGMIKNDYSEWYVIEVELGKHTKEEVIKQIHTFRNFTPTKDNSDYICRERKDLIKSRVESLITSSIVPKLMVIVNEDKEIWKSDLAKLSCEMCVFQIYNDFDNRKLYRISGEFPTIYTDFCHCKFEKSLPFAIKLLSNDFLNRHGIKNGDQLEIFFEGKSFKWERQDVANVPYLICNSATTPLDPISARYRLNYYSKNRTIQNRNLLSRLFSKIKTINQNTFVFIKD